MLELKIKNLVKKGMRAIDYNMLFFIYENSKQFENEYNTEIKPKLDLLNSEYVHFSMVRAYSYLIPFAVKIARYTENMFNEKDIKVPSVEEVDLDEFSRLILKKYLEGNNGTV